MPAKQALDDVTTNGAFKRKDAIFRNSITKDGPFPPAGNGRYMLYVCYACPWASRCLAVRAAKGLDRAIGLAVVHPLFSRTRPNDAEDQHEGWVFDPSFDDACTTDPVFGAKTVRELYEKVIEIAGGLPEGHTDTRFTVPILFDTQSKLIVSNESSEIMRFLNNDFDEFAEHPEVNLIPADLLPAIDEMNARVYEPINNGVYKCGFARSQEAYDDAVKVLFASLEEMESILSKQKYLVSNTALTEADIRLFVTIVRFDEVYTVHFKCAKKHICQFPALSAWMTDVYCQHNISTSVNMSHIINHYYRSHKGINPFLIVPATRGVDALLKAALAASRK